MRRNTSEAAVGSVMVLFTALLNAIVLKEAYLVSTRWAGLLVITLPLFASVLWSTRRKKFRNRPF
ncbi:MAG TPA: hypothetical protein VHK69_09410 [Chitinophagaceae bacterium]|nr:hypothetical protein [Chitinophagaceae bacterium]